MKIVCLSDTHGLHRVMHSSIPDGDVLIHAGDVTNNGNLRKLHEFNDWIGSFPHRYKIVIAGNHDYCFEREPELSAKILTSAIYLQDNSATIKGVKFYGSPWQPWFLDWAFNFPELEKYTGETARQVWSKIPDDTQVLITHGPPNGVRDWTNKEEAGCLFLSERIQSLKRLKLHVFGHIHEGYGTELRGPVQYVNASICDAQYVPKNAPIVVELNL